MDKCAKCGKDDKEGMCQTCIDEVAGWMKRILNPPTGVVHTIVPSQQACLNVLKKAPDGYMLAYPLLWGAFMPFEVLREGQ